MTPTIEDVLKKHLEGSQWYAPACDERIKAAMQEWASLNRQGCRWTKASERLPKPDKEIVFKWEDTKVKFVHRLNNMKDSNGNVGGLSRLLWLDDESIEPCATSSENEKLYMAFAEWAKESDLFYDFKTTIYKP